MQRGEHTATLRTDCGQRPSLLTVRDGEEAGSGLLPGELAVTGAWRGVSSGRKSVARGGGRRNEAWVSGESCTRGRHVPDESPEDAVRSVLDRLQGGER